MRGCHCVHGHEVCSSFPNTYCSWKLVMTKMTRMSGLPEALAMRFANQGGRWPSYKISNEAFVWPISFKHNESQTSCLKYKIYQCAFRCSSPWKERLHSPYEKVGPNLGCCTFQIEVMINAIHFWDLILFKFFLITTIGSWNIVLVVKMIIKWKKFQSFFPGQKGWKMRSGRNIRGIHELQILAILIWW